MQERQRLSESITATRKIETDTQDLVELIDMAQEEGDTEAEEEAEA